MTSYGRRAAGTPITDEERAELKTLAQRPDSEIDFSDIPERIYNSEAQSLLPLEEHTVTLCVDSEVAAWLEDAARLDAPRINNLLKREAKRYRLSSSASSTLLEKAG